MSITAQAGVEVDDQLSKRENKGGGSRTVVVVIFFFKYFFEKRKEGVPLSVMWLMEHPLGCDSNLALRLFKLG